MTLRHVSLFEWKIPAFVQLIAFERKTINEATAEVFLKIITHFVNRQTNLKVHYIRMLTVGALISLGELRHLKYL